MIVHFAARMRVRFASTSTRAHTSAREERRCDRRAAPVARASTSETSSSSSSSAETVRFGILRGSSATYRDDVTVYEDGVLDAVAIELFNAKLNAVVGTREEGEDGERLRGFARLVRLADKLSDGRGVVEQRDAVTRALLSIIPAPVRWAFKRLIEPATWVDEMNAKVTREAFAWLVGPCEIVPRESDGAMASVKLKKCRYLEQCGCAASCTNFCKIPTQRFFKEAFGVDARLDPNHEDGSCMMTFGVKPDVVDAAFAAPCYATCAKSCGTSDEPCHRLGKQPEF